MLQRLGWVLLCIALSCASAFSKETRSQLSGHVIDPKGAAIVGASVMVRNADTGLEQATKTNASGYYQATLLQPGNYEITAEMSGFKKLIRKGIELPVSSSKVVDLT